MTTGDDSLPMEAIVQFRLLADGRGVSVELELPNICQSYVDGVDNYDVENVAWSWVACLRVGDRSYVAGSDSSIEEGELVNEITAVLEPLWVPAWSGPTRLSIDMAMWFTNAWHAWSAAIDVDGSNLATIELRLAPSSLPDGEPFTSPIGSSKSAKESAARRDKTDFLVPERGVLRAEFNGTKLVWKGLDGNERPLSVPSTVPSVTLVNRVESAGDRLALFRSRTNGSYDEQNEWVTLFRVHEPERAVHLPTFLGRGGWDDTGRRFWTTRKSTTSSDARVVVFDADSGDVIGDFALGGAEHYPIRIENDRVYLMRNKRIDVIPLATGACERLFDAPIGYLFDDAYYCQFDPATSRIATCRYLGAGTGYETDANASPLGVRTAMHWLDVTTFAGGVVVVPDWISSFGFTPRGLLGVGDRLWHIDETGLRDLGPAGPEEYSARCLTTTNGVTRYWSLHLPAPHYVEA